MRNQVRFVLAILALVAVACGASSGGAGVQEDQPPSPTPPAIPTIMGLTETPLPDLPPEVQVTAPPGQVANLVYGSARSGEMGIHFLSTDGRFTGKIDIISEEIEHAVWPDISPDGTQIVFVSVTSTLRTIGVYTADIDGTNVREILGGDGMYPRWSPDGTQIVMSCNENTDICLADLISENILILTPESDDSIETYPNWTPGGEKIVFMSSVGLPTNGRFSEIYIMNADGSEPTALTSDRDAFNANPSVSSDGVHIVFESDRDSGVGSELYVMDIDGDNEVRITNDSAWNQNPSWSPNGNVILFSANFGDGNIDLYFINPDGSNRVRLTQHPGEDGGFRFGHTWLRAEQGSDIEFVTEAAIQDRPRAPSGTEAITNAIIFSTNSFNCGECLESGIYVINFDGANQTRLPIEGLYPTWSPDFKRFAYVSNGEIFIANSDGSGTVQITSAYRNFSSLNWSSGSGMILAGCSPYGQYDVCLINPQTGAINNLLETVSFGAGIPHPSWRDNESLLVGALHIDLEGQVISSIPFGGRISPDEKSLVTVISRQIVIMNPDGTGQVKLTNDAPSKGFPVWSPNGDLIVYMVAPGDGRLYLYSVKSNGDNAQQLVPRPIGIGPTNRPNVLDIFFGLNWATKP